MKVLFKFYKLGCKMNLILPFKAGCRNSQKAKIFHISRLFSR